MDRYVDRDKFRTLSHVFDDRCVKCGKENTPLHADHINPYSKGGISELTNIQPLCGHCNLVKHNSENIDYRKTFFARFPVDGKYKLFTRIRFLINVFWEENGSLFIKEIVAGWNLSDEQKKALDYELEGI